MSDVRALLKAKTKEREPQVQHPLAAYNASGQLRCTLCATLVKFGTPAAWKTHLESKLHKANALKETERKGKRKAQQSDAMDVDAAVDSDGGSTKKRKVGSTTTAGPSNGALPSDFFSDPNRTPIIPSEEDEADENTPPPTRSTVTVDAEFEAFEKALAKTRPPPSAMQEIYSRATVFAEPELVDVETLQADGFPPEVNAKEADAPTTAKVVGDEEPQEEETEAQKARRKELEEKELIMDRILEEERAQEAAEEKVTALRARFEAIKKQREVRKQAATKKT